MILAVYKPKGPSSNKFLTQIKKLTGIKKVGHAGTLDPLASGILVVAFGRGSTKKIGDEVKKEKEYIAKIKLGETSETDDKEGPKSKWPGKIVLPTKDYIDKVVLSYLGKFQQTPPLYSAVKISGVESYKIARAMARESLSANSKERSEYKLAEKGKTVEIKPREVELKEVEILDYEYPFLSIRMVTGPGFYVRSFARDLGEKLKTGGYISELERTRVGDFTKENSKTLEDLQNLSRHSELSGEESQDLQ